MGQFFSDKTEEAVKLMYTQFDTEGFKKATNLLTEAANEEDADALYFLSRCLLGNEFIWKYAGFEEDEAKSKELLRMSIQKGSALGVLGAFRINELTLAMLAQTPFKTLKDARDVVLQKAEAGQPFCQYMIGNTYYWDDIYEIEGLPHPLINPKEFEKLGKPKEREKKMTEIETRVIQQAIYWFEKSVQAGYIWCAVNLLNIYQDGSFGAPKDPVKHEKLLNFCAATGNPHYEYLLGDKLRNDEKYEEALRYYQSAAQKGELDAWHDLGAMHARGEGTLQDVKTALKYYEIAAESGYCYALFSAGFYYYHGKGTDVDYARAFYYLDKAAAANHKAAYALLATCYLKGLGVQQNYSTAKMYFEKAENTDTTLNGLGQIYADGLGVPEDIAKGISYFQQANDEEAKGHIARFKKGLFGGWKRR